MRTTIYWVKAGDPYAPTVAEINAGTPIITTEAPRFRFLERCSEVQWKQMPEGSAFRITPTEVELLARPT